MVDVLTAEQRSYNMSKIKGRNTKPEIALRKLLFRLGIRGYRVNYGVEGTPDVVFLKKKVAVFVDGCFWHKCPTHFVIPATRTEFWLTKVEGNVKRDVIVNQKLKNQGWTVLRFWEHEIRTDPEKVVEKIRTQLGASE